MRSLCVYKGLQCLYIFVFYKCLYVYKGLKMFIQVCVYNVYMFNTVYKRLYVYKCLNVYTYQIRITSINRWCWAFASVGLASGFLNSGDWNLYSPNLNNNNNNNNNDNRCSVIYGCVHTSELSKVVNVKYSHTVLLLLRDICLNEWCMALYKTTLIIIMM